ncbi:hypothetical protein JTE90_006322 [Oedothorax gibbosus]|uniref:Reverse transcriptase domain-containing protein n=1 Tax=Oedothorax gibbosus TaxID=931172 RepID=A0AAV6U258_9ARAC|nr:hypothetical protein JTE90_006322 [Oedothorax gibbosus]
MPSDGDDPEKESIDSVLGDICAGGSSQYSFNKLATSASQFMINIKGINTFIKSVDIVEAYLHRLSLRSDRPSHGTSLPCCLALLYILLAVKEDGARGVEVQGTTIKFLAYSDDILIAAPSTGDIQAHLNAISDSDEKAGLRFKPRKCASLGIRNASGNGGILPDRTDGNIVHVAIRKCGAGVQSLSDTVDIDHLTYAMKMLASKDQLVRESAMSSLYEAVRKEAGVDPTDDNIFSFVLGSFVGQCDFGAVL